MNLRFTASILALALSISASARSVGEANSIVKLVDHSTLFHDGNGEKLRARRRVERISTSSFDPGATNGRSFYYPDVGILQGRKHRRRFGNVLMNGRVKRSYADAADSTEKAQRFLEAEVAPLCGTNGTCPPSACTCRANGGDFISDQCAPVINSVCNGYTDADGKEWNIDGCIKDYQDRPGLHKYLKTEYCQLSKCFDEGGTHGSCYCQLYHYACLTVGDERPFQTDNRALGFCAADECCQNKTDEDGRKTCTFAPSRVEYIKGNPRCGTNGTCAPGFCDCYVNAMDMGIIECVSPINALCNGVTDANGTKWEIEGCIRDYPGYPDYQLYSKTVYCEFANCFADGGTYGSCYCQMYRSLCDQFGDVRKYSYSTDAVGFCTLDTCCKSEASEEGKLSCFELTNSTPSNSSLTGDATSNPSVQNSSASGEGGTPDAITDETPNDAPSSSAPSASSAGAMSSLVTVAAVLYTLGSDAM